MKTEGAYSIWKKMDGRMDAETDGQSYDSRLGIR